MATKKMKNAKNAPALRNAEPYKNSAGVKLPEVDIVLEAEPSGEVTSCRDVVRNIEYVGSGSSLPEIQAGDEGKVLTVVDNSGTLEPQWAEASGGVPTVVANLVEGVITVLDQADVISVIQNYGTFCLRVDQYDGDDIDSQYWYSMASRGTSATGMGYVGTSGTDILVGFCGLIVSGNAVTFMDLGSGKMTTN